MLNEALKREETSFTIIAYPIKEVGEPYEEIFHEVRKVNTLDKKVYQTVQEKIIDALNEGSFVHVTGKGSNQTDKQNEKFIRGAKLHSGEADYAS